MSRAEAGKEADREFFAAIFARAGKAHTIGLTGVPGSGKSTLVRALAQAFRRSGRTVGIVAVDPSSPFPAAPFWATGFAWVNWPAMTAFSSVPWRHGDRLAA